jgi:hypothetical protein
MTPICNQEREDRPLKIYFAGPYTPKNCSLHDAARLAQRNTDTAVKIGNALMAKGHYVFVPHLTHYLHIHESCEIHDADFWYELDNSFLNDWANAFFYISPSWGADQELKLAESKGFKIFRVLSEVPQL